MKVDELVRGFNVTGGGDEFPQGLMTCQGKAKNGPEEKGGAATGVVLAQGEGF